MRPFQALGLGVSLASSFHTYEAMSHSGEVASMSCRACVRSCWVFVQVLSKESWVIACELDKNNKHYKMAISNFRIEEIMSVTAKLVRFCQIRKQIIRYKPINQFNPPPPGMECPLAAGQFHLPGKWLAIPMHDIAYLYQQSQVENSLYNCVSGL